MGDTEQLEELHVSLDQSRSGVRLKSGHQVVLIVTGLHGTPRPPEPEPEPGASDPESREDEPDSPVAAQSGAEEEAREPAAEADAEPVADREADAETPAEPEPAPVAVTRSLLATLEAAHFETAKSFPLPTALPTFRAVAAQVAAEPNRVLLIVGHTDAAGGPDYNLKLSDERAGAVAAYLRNAVDAWLPFYANADEQKRWGVREDQHMLSALPFDAPDYDGEVDGVAGPRTSAAWRALQERSGLPATGKPDDASRRALVLEYMQAEGTTVAPEVAIETLGCGERHLARETGDGVSNDQNRRVDVFAFEGAPVQPAPAECRDGTHPGCTVYDRWKGAVTGAITGEPVPRGHAEVLLELEESAADLLPDGALVLSPEGLEEQQVELASAERANGVLRVRFSWEDTSRKVRLEARAAGKTTTLWEDQPAGDPKTPIVWSGAIADLYPPPAPGDGAPVIFGSAPDDLETTRRGGKA